MATKVGAIPDLRFENSYARAIASANGSWIKIVAITVRDQVFLPFAQGFLWNLMLLTFKTWRLAASTSGSGWGDKFRRWWLQLNNYPVPPPRKFARAQV